MAGATRAGPAVTENEKVYASLHSRGVGIVALQRLLAIAVVQVQGMGHLPQKSSTEPVICPVSPLGQPCAPGVQLIGCAVLPHILQGGLPGREATGLQAVSSSAMQLSVRFRNSGLRECCKWLVMMPPAPCKWWSAGGITANKLGVLQKGCQVVKAQACHSRQ